MHKREVEEWPRIRSEKNCFSCR